MPRFLLRHVVFLAEELRSVGKFDFGRSSPICVSTEEIWSAFRLTDWRTVRIYRPAEVMTEAISKSRRRKMKNTGDIVRRNVYGERISGSSKNVATCASRSRTTDEYIWIYRVFFFLPKWLLPNRHSLRSPRAAGFFLSVRFFGGRHAWWHRNI